MVGFQANDFLHTFFGAYPPSAVAVSESCRLVSAAIRYEMNFSARGKCSSMSVECNFCIKLI